MEPRHPKGRLLTASDAREGLSGSGWDSARLPRSASRSALGLSPPFSSGGFGVKLSEVARWDRLKSLVAEK